MILMVAALKAELQPFLLNFGAINPRPVGLGTLYSYSQIDILRLGVGRLKASETLRTYLKTAQPEAVLNIGFAGALRPDLPLCQAYHIDSVSSETDKTTYTLETLQNRIALPKAHLLTVDEPVLNSQRKETLTRLYVADLVDMEIFDLVKICREAALPFYAVKIVSDQAGDQAERQFRKYFKTCAQKLFETIQPVLPK